MPELMRPSVSKTAAQGDRITTSAHLVMDGFDAALLAFNHFLEARGAMGFGMFANFDADV